MFCQAQMVFSFGNSIVASILFVTILRIDSVVYWYVDPGGTKRDRKGIWIKRRSSEQMLAKKNSSTEKTLVRR